MTAPKPSLNKAVTAPRTQDPQATTASENTDSVVTDSDSTVQSPLAPIAALEGEQKDHVMTLAKANNELPEDETRVLMLEQMDHQRTLRQALGTVVSGEDDEELREAAQKNVDRLIARSKSYQPAKKEEIEAKPSTWSIKAEDGGNITAINRITGTEYKGPAAEFLRK